MLETFDTTVLRDIFIWRLFERFSLISFDRDIVWVWFLVLRVALYLEITLHTHIMVTWCLENFLQHFEVQKVGQKQHFLSKMRRIPFTIIKGIRRILHKKCYFWLTFWTSKCCRKFSRHHETMMWVCKVVRAQHKLFMKVLFLAYFLNFKVL